MFCRNKEKRKKAVFGLFLFLKKVIPSQYIVRHMVNKPFCSGV